MTLLLPDEVAFIQSKLSPQSAQLRHKYPNAVCHAAKTSFLKQGAIDHAKKLEKIEQLVNQGVTGNGFDEPQY